ncbi:hypothetical protein Tco_0079872 [Tanacetum coccineum]
MFLIRHLLTQDLTLQRLKRSRTECAGLKRWSKCLRFVSVPKKTRKSLLYALESRALYMVERNVQTLDLLMQIRSPCNVKANDTTEYCPATENPKEGARSLFFDFERNKSEAYHYKRSTNWLLMCPELVSSEKRKD